MARPDGPAYIVEVPSTLVRAICPACEWEGPIRNAANVDDAALVRRDLHTHNEEHDEWPSRDPERAALFRTGRDSPYYGQWDK